jgi:hypothetical protein
MMRAHLARAMTAPEKKPLLERLVGYRDAGLLLAGVAYALGYASRSLHAFDYNLGPLPGARFDYVVAGALLLLPPGALCLAGWLLWRGIKRAAAWAAKRPGGTQRVSNALGAAWMLGIAVVAFAPNPMVANGAMFLFITAFALSIAFAAANEESPGTAPSARETSASSRHWVSAFLERLGVFLMGLAMLLMALLPLILFVGSVLFGAIALTHVPQEFGGVKPKCAVIDLVPEQLSPELLTLLVGNSPNPSASKVLRSQRLELYTTSAPWLVRVHDSVPGAGSSRSLRLGDSAVRSVEWCR